MKGKVQAFIFDLDGTLTDTLLDLAAALNHSRRLLGMAPVEIALVQQMIGNGIKDLIGKSFANDRIDVDEEQIDQAIKLMTDYYCDHLVDNTCAYPGVVDTLKFLRENNCKSAVVTNKRSKATLQILEKLDLIQYFDCVIGDSDGYALKPAPDGLLGAAEKMGVEPENCLMVGDNHTDLGAAAAAGIKSVFCRYGFGCKQDRTADYEIDNFAELKDFI